MSIDAGLTGNSGWRVLPVPHENLSADTALTAQGGAEHNALFLIEAGVNAKALRYDPAEQLWRPIAAPPSGMNHISIAPIGVAHILLTGHDLNGSDGY